MESRTWPCPTCDEVRDHVQPPCPDGHTDDGGECPEWACTGCGGAVLLGAAAGHRPARGAARAA